MRELIMWVVCISWDLWALNAKRTQRASRKAHMKCMRFVQLMHVILRNHHVDTYEFAYADNSSMKEYDQDLRGKTTQYMSINREWVLMEEDLWSLSDCTWCKYQDICTPITVSEHPHTSIHIHTTQTHSWYKCRGVPQLWPCEEFGSEKIGSLEYPS